MSEHHEMSPSHYNPWSHCVHWESDGKTSAEASAGTNHHSEMEKGLKDPNYEPNTAVARWAVAWIKNKAGDAFVLSEQKFTGSLPFCEGIFGTADAYWVDGNGAYHFADLKSFSDGSADYTPQLKGYAALFADRNIDLLGEVHLHILHGGVFHDETLVTDFATCIDDTEGLLDRVTAKEFHDPEINRYCQYCKHKGECKAMNNAITTVADSSVSFSELPLVKKLVVCDAIEKVIKSIKDDAKAEAIANGGFLETDGVRYEIKERAGKGKVTNLSELAYAVNAVKDSVGYNGITTDQLLALCDLPKTALVNAMKEANADRKDVKKKDIEAWCAGFYTKGEPTQYLTRVS